MEPTSVLNVALGAGVVLAGLGYGVGQFFSARRKGEGDALALALQEVAAMKLRADRFEIEMHRQAQELAEVKAENITMRTLITGGAPVLEAVEKAKKELEMFATAEHEKTRAMIAAIRGER